MEASSHRQSQHRATCTSLLQPTCAFLRDEVHHPGSRVRKITFIAWHPAPLDLHQGGEAPGHHHCKHGHTRENMARAETMARSRLRSFWHVRAHNAVSLPSFGAPLPHFTVFSRLFFQRITIVFLPARLALSPAWSTLFPGSPGSLQRQTPRASTNQWCAGPLRFDTNAARTRDQGTTGSSLERTGERPDRHRGPHTGDNRGSVTLAVWPSGMRGEWLTETGYGRVVCLGG
jgi:hypothetical protein